MELILQPFCHFTYVTAHSPTLLSLYLHHSPFSNTSVASPTSQFIHQPFFHFSYVTGFSLTSPGETSMMSVCIFGFKGASTSKVIGARNEMMDDYDGQMIFGVLVGLRIPDIRLTGEENPEKTSPRKLVPTGERTRARCVTSAHATTCSTAVDFHDVIIREIISIY